MMKEEFLFSSLEKGLKKETSFKKAMVSEFLKQAWFIKNEEQEYIKTVKGSKGGPGSAMSPYPNFNLSSNVAALPKAIIVKQPSLTF